MTQLHHPDDEGLPAAWDGVYGGAAVVQHDVPGVVLSNGEKVLFDGTRTPRPSAASTTLADVL